MLITPDILKLIAMRKGSTHPALADHEATHWCALINEVCPRYGMTDKNLFEEFLAQILHESDCFQVREENLNYTSPERLMEVWPLRFLRVASAMLYVRKPEDLANYVYRGRMGNNEPGDGWRFRGRGLLQITGRDSYTLYWRYKKEHLGYPVIGLPDTVEEMAGMISANDLCALDASLWEFAIDKKLLSLALTDQFKVITRRINGGTIGIQEREHYYVRAKEFLA